MGEFTHKSHSVTVLLYHLVLSAKYRRTAFDDSVDDILKKVCLDRELRNQVKFLEIGTDKDHVHFLVQSVPTYSVTKIVTIIKSLTQRGFGILKGKRLPPMLLNHQMSDARMACSVW